MRGGTYQMLTRFDRDGRLQRTDGIFTTNKAIGTRVPAKVDIAALAAAMKPTGVLSPRAAAYAGFNRGPIFISYGRPAVRERTVWGGTLIPFDTIWRTGAERGDAPRHVEDDRARRHDAGAGIVHAVDAAHARRHVSHRQQTGRPVGHRVSRRLRTLAA